MMARIEKWDEVHGNQAPDEKMMAFLDSFTDQYAILQLRRSEDTVCLLYTSLETWLFFCPFAGAHAEGHLLFISP